MNFSLALPPNQYGCGYQAWRYAPWREAFYPKGLIQKRELEFVSRALPTIELNGSFYALQRPSSYLRWYEQTSLGFIFSVKATRYITHVLRLRDIEQSMANFFASGLLSLKEKLGPNIEDITTDFIYACMVLKSCMSVDIRMKRWMIGRHGLKSGAKAHSQKIRT